MAHSAHVLLGEVVSTHGLKGEVGVALTTGLPFSALEGLEVWFVPPPPAVRSARIVSVRQGSRGPLVRFDAVGDITLAASLRGAQVLAREDDLPVPLEPTDEEADVIGYQVYDDRHGLLGEVTEIIYTGANDVWVIEGPLGEVLVPVIDEVVVGVDEDAERIDVRLLPGLLPEEAEET
ncbi:MAG: ribosome maturation factor RimM [Coriobacteriia bacterium]